MDTPEQEAEWDEDEAAELINRFRDRVVLQDDPVALLLAKMDAWLLQQPEFIRLLNAPRKQRRNLAIQLAKHITTYPMRGRVFGR